MGAQETTVYTAVLISCVVIGIIILYFIISIVRQQRKNLELTRKNILTEISTMEKERSRIAIDLHDDLGPILSVIKFQIDTVKANTNSTAHLRQASEHIDAVITKLREIANNLMPTSLLRKGLISSIEEYTSAIEIAHNVQINLTYTTIPELAPDVNINLYRIIKEVVYNSAKHSRATMITITFTANENKIIVHCLDNGIGFNVEKALAEATGLGLKNIKSRIDVMGGTMVYESKENKGTAFLFQIPMI